MDQDTGLGGVCRDAVVSAGLVLKSIFCKFLRINVTTFVSMRRCQPNNWWGSQAFYLLKAHQTWISVGKYHKWSLGSGNLPSSIFRWDIITSPRTNVYFLPIYFTWEETLPEADWTHAIDSISRVISAASILSAVKVTQDMESIAWVCCASNNAWPPCEAICIVCKFVQQKATFPGIAQLASTVSVELVSYQPVSHQKSVLASDIRTHRLVLGAPGSDKNAWIFVVMGGRICCELGKKIKNAHIFQHQNMYMYMYMFFTFWFFTYVKNEKVKNWLLEYQKLYYASSSSVRLRDRQHLTQNDILIWNKEYVPGIQARV